MSNGILSNLTTIANLCAESMKSYSSANNNPKQIEDAIHVGSAQPQGKGFMIDITIPLSEAPMAAAYEWGSGEHAMRGTKGKYRIPREGESGLKIAQEDWPDFEWPLKPGPAMIGFDEGGFLLRYVEHPGVEARPYIRPAIDDTLKEVKNIMREELLAQLSIVGKNAKGKHYEVIVVGSRSS